MSDILLKVEGLSAGYGAMPVLRNLDLTVARGEIVAMVGSNGAGKTTLLRVLSRMLGSTGKIELDGQDLTGLTPDEAFALGLVQVPEGRQLFDQMSVEENLLMGAYRRRDKAGIAATLEHVYELFPRMRERRQQRAGSMSGGEQQMCAMGRALMAQPKLLMVDEMSLGLAPVIVDQLLDVLSEIRKQGVTVLLVEQDVFAALQVADRGYVLELGEITRMGTAKELTEDPEVKRAYLGI
ncbi:ABC transporter ATP-binding protein [Pandoraea sp.]|uniref:ABC transporter ATP-binding protein n=1 Tax=Pandoraea sp. TaxID=1883445 RepID=UPI00121EC550|nr:ABC transporter ATP-binding protein [Pandoraea sp.]TAL54885.1 MAG: ABC transporter ATP-binding protein [Pandoraea sp.]TAM18347.1 MAG: ABC transporter ATP-binding protein [Pandoraea sp.]